jgi:Tfp pilus tip-associated adhesin PilY1
VDKVSWSSLAVGVMLVGIGVTGLAWSLRVVTAVDGSNAGPRSGLGILASLLFVSAGIVLAVYGSDLQGNLGR